MTTTMQYRQAMVDNCSWAVSDKAHWNYAEVRPIPRLPARTSSSITTDCSGFVTMMAEWSEMPDPNGLNYNGTGYTGTMLSHLPHIPFDETWRGDLCVFGGGTGTHVVVLAIGGVREADPMVYSHGFQGGPIALRLSQEKRYHSGEPTTFLRIIPNG
jgi:hypothetical protein